PWYRRSTRGISVRERLHARRAVTDHRAPVLWVVGVPDHRLLRADRALRNAAGLHVPRGHAAPAWRRCDPRLGSVPLSDGRAWTRLLRRHASLRARRSAAGVSPGLEQRDLQLRPQRSPRVPVVERTVLAQSLPQRWSARRRR